MTEKKQRFENRLNKHKKYFNALNPVYDNKKENALNVFEMIDLLNDFDEAFNTFEIGLNELKVIGDYQAERIEELEKENERLKKERNHFEKKKTEYLTEWNTCRIQNTELKNLIQEAYNNERTEIGKNVLKQLIEQI